MVMNVVIGFFGSSSDPAAQARLQWMTVPVSGSPNKPYFIDLIDRAQAYTGT